VNTTRIKKGSIMK